MPDAETVSDLAEHIRLRRLRIYTFTEWRLIPLQDFVPSMAPVSCPAIRASSQTTLRLQRCTSVSDGSRNGFIDHLTRRQILGLDNRCR